MTTGRTMNTSTIRNPHSALVGGKGIRKELNLILADDIKYRVCPNAREEENE